MALERKATAASRRAVHRALDRLVAVCRRDRASMGAVAEAHEALHHEIVLAARKRAARGGPSPGRRRAQAVRAPAAAHVDVRADRGGSHRARTAARIRGRGGAQAAHRGIDARALGAGLGRRLFGGDAVRSRRVAQRDPLARGLRPVHRAVGACRSGPPPRRRAPARPRRRSRRKGSRARRARPPPPRSRWRAAPRAWRRLFRSCSGSSTQNSSPPMRAAVSTERIERRRDIPTCISTLSPAWWPCESLIRLSPSMSIRSRPNGRW